MFSETSFNKRENAGEISRSPATSQQEVVSYIGDMAVELQAISQKAGLTMLSFMLSMVVLCANESIAGDVLKAVSRASAQQK